VSIDQLKVDCESVGGIHEEPAALARLRALVELSRHLDATVIATGVAQDAQREALWQHGCIAGQGSMYGRPTTAGDLQQRLLRGYRGHSGILAPPLPIGQVRRSRAHRLRTLRRGLSH
jgi:EAL domain-containing protein (putative c-di-GMP-specific phosphodiesterase class I)